MRRNVFTAGTCEPKPRVPSPEPLSGEPQSLVPSPQSLPLGRRAVLGGLVAGAALAASRRLFAQAPAVAMGAGARPARPHGGRW